MGKKLPKHFCQGDRPFLTPSSRLIWQAVAWVANTIQMDLISSLTTEKKRPLMVQSLWSKQDASVPLLERVILCVQHFTSHPLHSHTKEQTAFSCFFLSFFSHIAKETAQCALVCVSGNSPTRHRHPAQSPLLHPTLRLHYHDPTRMFRNYQFRC